MPSFGTKAFLQIYVFFYHFCFLQTKNAFKLRAYVSQGKTTVKNVCRGHLTGVSRFLDAKASRLFKIGKDLPDFNPQFFSLSLEEY